MNERIRELLKQAEERYPRHLAVAVPEVVVRQDALEKFAELIVLECARWLGNREFASPEALKQHFGVEE